MITFYKGEDFTLTFTSAQDISGYTKSVSYFTPFGTPVTAVVTPINNFSFSAKFASTDTATLKAGALNVVVTFTDANNNKSISKAMPAQILDSLTNGNIRTADISSTSLEIVFEQNTIALDINFVGLTNAQTTAIDNAEQITNKTSDIVSNLTSTDKYPTTKGVNDFVQNNIIEQVRSQNINKVPSSKLLDDSIKGVLAKPQYVQMPDVDSNILEMFVKIDGVDNTDINLSSVTIDWTNKQATLYCFVDSTYSLGLVIPAGNLTEGTVYEFTNQLKDKKAYGYIVFKNTTSVDLSGLTNMLSTNTTIIGKTIESYIENGNQLNLVSLKTYFINNDAANNSIKELYIPNIESYGNLTVASLTCLKTSIRLFLYSGNQRILYAAEANTPYGYDYYKLGAITPIIEDATLKTVGYVIFKYSSDYDVSGTNYSINTSVIKDINNSPTIKGMINSDEQIVLLGDSILGQPALNVLPFVLSGLTSKKVFQLGFGGCTMAWRTQAGGSTPYDWFSFVSIADAIASGDYSLQENATGTVDYRFQIDQLTSIDWTKKVTIICNYVNNDLTNDIQLGNYYNSSVAINNLNKSKFLEAQIYGVNKILTAHPNTKFIFLGKIWRMYNDNTPEFEYTNPTTNLNAQDFIDAEAQNCKLMGLRFENIINWGVRTPFNINNFTLDGTHFNGAGATEFAKYLYNLWGEVNKSN